MYKSYEELARQYGRRFDENKRIVAYRPMVYICSPYAGDIKTNTEKARKYSRYAISRDAIPVTPHLMYPQFVSEDTERDLGLFMGMVLLGKCDEVWVFGDRISDGMRAEINVAKKWKRKVRYFTEELKEYT